MTHLDIIMNGSDADALRAIEAMESRIYGKPTERVETSTVPSTLEEVRSMSREERRAVLARLEAEGHLANVIPLDPRSAETWGLKH